MFSRVSIAQICLNNSKNPEKMAFAIYFRLGLADIMSEGTSCPCSKEQLKMITNREKMKKFSDNINLKIKKKTKGTLTSDHRQKILGGKTSKPYEKIRRSTQPKNFHPPPLPIKLTSCPAVSPTSHLHSTV